MAWFDPILTHALDTTGQALAILVVPALVFGLLALALKRRDVLSAARQAASETRTNLAIHFLDAVWVGPLLAAALAVMADRLVPLGLPLVPAEAWARLPAWLVALLAVFAGDFVGYWRHRLEHTRYLWPAHAVHHSDTAMTWLTLARFHPVNRVTTTLFDGLFLLALGFPQEAVLANAIVRHYYGHFVHADLPWTFGILGRVFVSPAMHRWHHSLDRKAFHTNYATVFALFDTAFGTWRVPGRCDAALGVTDAMGEGVLAQLRYPFTRAAYAKRWVRRAKPGTVPAPEKLSQVSDAA